ncbi:GNAT family N-acetyltransferase [uncultured Jannaschia sp.]|uniref:GNAT family N-acetyltransferase n=1 Tax=uncultured Jannaschia sp. TaxID=293347 RepID=UPI0026128509|nr:GNAT family N-acetyltransferase [uncultured Jannaschia sp.]
MLEIREGRAADLPALIEIFWRGVHEGAAPRYDDAERVAWLPARPDVAAFAQRLADQTVRVAERDGAPVGFMTLRGDGYLDLAYVAPEERGQGTADALLAVLENGARAAGHTRLTARASDLARPFLARLGWTVVAPAPQVRDGVTIRATDMMRDLGHGTASRAA